MAIKPRILIDLKTEKIHPFSKRERRVNLFDSRKKQDFIHKLVLVVKPMLAISVMVYMMFGAAMAPISNHLSAADDTSAEERAALEERLAELERQIEQHEITIDEYRAQKKTLQGEINELNARVRKLNLQIKATTLSIDKLGNEIDDNKVRIVDAEDKLSVTKVALSRLLQQVYEDEQVNLLEVLLKSPKLSDFFGGINDLLEVQNSLSITVQKVTELRTELLDEREQLALRKSDVVSLQRYQASQKEAIQETKRKKDDLLQKTKGEESKYQDILKETRKSAAQIRSRLFELLGGGELTFEAAYELARFAESATGIRAAFVLAVLDRESAFGQNVGRCPYYDPEKNRYYMHPKRDVPPFLEITSKLGINPERIQVSCPISSDGSYGGAMGPAQFIPSTWVIYEDEIGEITGNNPPSPWRNGDAFVATALYLSDNFNSRSCKNYASQIPSQRQKLQERCAAAKYYAGGRWYRYRWAYGEPVVEKAASFQQDINVLNS